MKRMIFPLGPTALLVLALAGCGGGPGTPADGGSAAAGAVTTQEAASGDKTPSNPGTGIINSTTLTSCDKQEGKVSAAGKVTPPEGVKGTVKVSVSWVDPKTSSVLAQASETLKDAKAGKAADWTVNTTLGKVSTDVNCVLSATVLP